MVTNTIKAYERSIADLFCEKFRFTVPPFQRSYAWTTEHAGELLEDLLQQLRSEHGRVGPYFLGSIVVIKRDGIPQADIVDGQQRIATLTILLSVLRDLATPEQSSSIHKYVTQSGNEFEDIRDSQRVQLREQDAGVFEKYIQKQGATNNLPDAEIFESDSHCSIVTNAKYLRDELIALSEAERFDLTKYVVANTFLVVVQATDYESAYRVFAVMNDRGLDLSPTDVLKAEVVGAIEGEDREDYNAHWELIEEGLGRERFRELFGHIDFIFHRQKRRTSLEQAFRRNVLRAIAPKRFIDDFLVPMGEAYLSVVEASYRSEKHAQQINHCLKQLGRLDFSDWQSAALLAVVRFAKRSDLLLAFLRRLERLSYAFFLLRTHVNWRIARYAKIVEELHDQADPRAITSLELSSDEITDVLSFLHGPVYKNARVRKLLLLRIDEALSEAGAEYDHSMITVEHVLPQSVSDSSPWHDAFPDPVYRSEWVHRLGNLVLLSRRKNSQAGRLAFREKKHNYFARDGVTPFVLTAEVRELDDWTPTELSARQDRLVGVLVNLWDLRQPDDLSEIGTVVSV
ncbi:MAG: DUF262 domain-containing protein [Pseudomonadota bacterium]